MLSLHFKGLGRGLRQVTWRGIEVDVGRGWVHSHALTWVCTWHGFSILFFCNNRGHQITHIGGIKQYKSMVILRDFPYNSAVFGLVI